MSQSTKNDGSHRWLKFENMKCWCNKRAAVRISGSKGHQYRLYQNCEDRGKLGSCKYFNWCEPTGEIFFLGDMMMEDSQSDIKNVAQSELKKDLHSGQDQQRGEEELRSLKKLVKLVDKSVDGIRVICQIILALTILGLVIDLFK